MSVRMRGTVINKLTGARGPYGFIGCPDGVNRFFMPSLLMNAGNTREAQIETFDKIAIGTPVEFSPADNHRQGPRALQVTVMIATIDLGDDE